MSMKILLVNPNTMKTPPVIPIGLEYLLSALKKHNHNVEILDLTFEPKPRRQLQKRLLTNTYDIVGFTIRNIDSCIFFNNEFYLPAIRKLVQIAKRKNLPVILGGAGFSAMPNEILDFLQADYGIIGPGEIMLLKFLELWQSDQVSQKVYDGRQYGPDIELTHIRGKNINYTQYTLEEGIVGFETHSGCDNQCPYCIEAGTKVWFKKIPNIIEEIENIVNQDYTHFHLCDAEFNTDLGYSIDFCKALVNKSLPLKWTLYMKPTPYSEELFRLLSESNAYLITLTVDSDKSIQKINNYSYDDLKKIIELCKKYKIELAIDLLVGYPNESLESVKEMLSFFKKERPNKVGISFYYRLSRHTMLGKLIQKDKELQKALTKPYTEEDNFLEPIFYRQIDQTFIDDLIQDDDIFHIAGVKPGVNYQL